MQRESVVWLVHLPAIFAVTLLLALILWRAWSRGGRASWAIVRQVSGWSCIVIGLLGLILPGPGIALLIIGVMLVGQRHPLIRRISVGVKLILRRWSGKSGVRGWIGTHGRQLAHALGIQLRRAHAKVKESNSPQH